MKVVSIVIAFVVYANIYAGSSLTKAPTYQATWRDPHFSQTISYTLSTVKDPVFIDAHLRKQTHTGTLTVGDLSFDLALLCIQAGRGPSYKIAIKYKDCWYYAQDLPVDVPHHISVRHALSRIFADLFKTINLEA